MSVVDQYFTDPSIFSIPCPLTTTQLAKASPDSAKQRHKSIETISSELSTSSEETPSSDPSEYYGNSASETDSSSAGSDSTASNETTRTDSDDDVTTEEDAQPVILPTATTAEPPTSIQCPVSKAELISSENKRSAVSQSDPRASYIPSTPSHRASKSQDKLRRPMGSPGIDSPDSFEQNALIKPPSHNRPITMTCDLPPELAGGWGEDPEPALWDWKGMPFDYMGILEEQRRTVYYELHERDGQEESVVKDNKKGNCDLRLILDGKYGHGKGGRVRGDYRGNTFRRPNNRSEDQSDGKCSPWVPRGRGRGRGSLHVNYKSLDHARSKQEQCLTEEHSHAVDVAIPSIIDTPIDLYDTAGLISADPDRLSLPILESKDDIKNFSAAWTKEGKREREMSYLILPRPEKVTMPAAILPKPDKFGKRKSWESTMSARPSENGKVEESTAAPDVEGSDALVRTDQYASAAGPLNAGQLLLQLITLLRQDDAALASLKSIVDGIASSSRPPAPLTQELKVEAPPLSPPVREMSLILQNSESAPRRSSETEGKPEIPDPTEAKKPPSGVEAKIPPPARDARPVPAALVKPIITQHQIDETEKEISPAEEDEIMIFPKKKTKSHNPKDRHDKDEKHKSKSKHSSKESSGVVPLDDCVVVAPLAPEDDDLMREELWYFRDGVADDADESPDKGILKPKISVAVVNERPHIVGKLYEPPRLHASQKSSKHAEDVARTPAIANVADKSDHDRKYVETDKLRPRPKSPSAPFDFNPPLPRRIKRRVILVSNDASTQTTTPPKTPPSAPPAEIILNPSLEKSATAIHVIAKPAVIRPAVILSPPETSARATVKPASVESPPHPKLAKTTTAKLVPPVTLPDWYTGSDEVYMKTLKNVDAGDDLMIVSKAKVVESVNEGNVSSHPHSKIVPDVLPFENVLLKQDLSAAMSRDGAGEAFASMKGDPTALFEFLSAITSSGARMKEMKPKREKEKEKKPRRDKDEKKPGKMHRRFKIVESGEDLFGNLLGDEDSVSSLPILHPTP